MKRNLLFLIALPFVSGVSFSQTVKVHGKITNARLEPLAFVSVQVKELRYGTVTKEDGTYEMELATGKYDLVYSMIGYKPRVITVVVKGHDYLQNIILEADERNELSEVVISKKVRDRSEEIIKNVIRSKESIQSAAGAYSCSIYIKAVQEDSTRQKRKGKRKQSAKDTVDINADLRRMAMAEIILHYDHGSMQNTREERIGITKRGNAESLFYLTTTDGDFNFYNNLVKTPSISEIPFLSPISYSGLIAYRFRIIKTNRTNNGKTYTISVRPRQMTNATVEGEVTIADSSWVILHTRFVLPPYHLPEYDFFEVEQNYSFIDSTAWMLVRQQFTYYSKSGKGKKSGITVARYKDFELNKSFGRKYFGTELSSSTQEAYEKDSLFWQQNRTEPLTPKEIRFIRYKDSIFRATHTEAYLDSMDKRINKVTWQKLLYEGQTLSNHEKERTWHFPPLPSIYEPFQFGGARIGLTTFYNKTYKSRKNISVFSNFSYGIRNKDLNGEISISRMYNPFNRGFYRVSAGRRFEYIFQGDAWINMIKRSNIFLDNTLGLAHGLELVNGLFLYTDLDFAFRKSVSDYKTNSQVDSLFGDLLKDNQAVDFDAYNAVYGKIRLQYTPGQRYIREPKEKIILGSKWPTFYAMWRKGIPGPFNSKVDFNYLEFGIEQQLKIGLAGISNYTIKTGSFLSRKDLRLVDYQYQRRGDPLLFLNPNEAFQALDSTFPVFKRFYQGHLVHEFNGVLINKIPLLKDLQLREVAGAGFLIAPERKLRYVETFAGIERVFKWPFNVDGKFKLGVYVVGSAANKFRNPVQFKIGITTWDRRKNKWF